MAAKTTEGRRGAAGTSGSVKDKKDASQLGRAAQQLLDNKTLDKALNEMQKNVFEWFTGSEMLDKEQREEMYRFMKTIKNFKAVLKVYVTKGANAQQKLEVIQNGGKRSTRP